MSLFQGLFCTLLYVVVTTGSVHNRERGVRISEVRSTVLLLGYRVPKHASYGNEHKKTQSLLFLCRYIEHTVCLNNGYSLLEMITCAVPKSAEVITLR